MGFSLSDMEALAKLLTPVQVEQDHIPISDITKPTPAQIGPQDLLNVQVAAPKAHGRAGPVSSQAASWAEEEEDDGQEMPEYEFKYKQRVTTSDNFLGMSGKDPSSSCCEHLVVVVQLPKAQTASELQLDTTATALRLVSPTYKLQLSLPHDVDEERGAAKWDSKKKTLIITLPIIRQDAFA